MTKSFLIFILLTNVVFGQTSNPIELMESQINKANQLLKIKKIDSVHYFLGKVIDSDRMIPISYENENERYKRDSILKNAVTILDSILKLKPNSVSPFYRAAFQSKLHNYDEAIIDYKKVIQIDSNQFSAHYNLGKLYERMGDFNKSLNSYSKAIEVNDSISTLYLNRGFVYLKLEKYSLAVKDFELALVKPENDKQDSFTYNNLGFAFFKQGNFKDAIENIQKSIELFERNSYAHKNLGLVYLKQNKLKEACICLDRAENLGYSYQYDQEVTELINTNCKVLDD